MIIENYVSFEIAKLLKEKGFDTECHSHYYPCHYPDGSIKYKKDMGAQRGTKTWYNVYSLKNLPKDHYLAPTLQMAMKWLREEKDILISVNPTLDKDGFVCVMYYIWNIDDIETKAITSGLYSLEGYNECIEAAIKYCLENLI